MDDLRKDDMPSQHDLMSWRRTESGGESHILYWPAPTWILRR